MHFAMPCIFKPDMHHTWLGIMPCFMWWLFTMLFASFRCCFFGLVSTMPRLWGSVRLRPFVFFMDSFFFLAGFQARWTYPRNHFYLCLLVARSFAMPQYLLLAIPCLPYCQVNPLTHLILANRCLAMLPLCSAPLIPLLVAGEDWISPYYLVILMHLYTWWRVEGSASRLVFCSTLAALVSVISVLCSRILRSLRGWVIMGTPW